MRLHNRRLLLFCLPALVALAVAAWLLWPSTAITRENAERIRPGMTLAEVEAILGGPPRDESTGPRIKEGDPPEAAESGIYLFQLAVGNARAIHPCKLWQSDGVLIRVDLDADERVTGSDWLAVRRVHEGALDRLRRWLGL
jgi:hypothetical protein